MVRLWRKGNPSTLLVGMQTGAATVENSIEFPQNQKLNSLLTRQFHCWDYTLRILKHQSKRTYAPQCSQQHNLQFTNAKCCKQPKCPSVNEWTKTLWYIYIMEYYTAERKKELLPFVTAQTELESIMLSEVSQAVREKYHMISPVGRT